MRMRMSTHVNASHDVRIIRRHSLTARYGAVVFVMSSREGLRRISGKDFLPDWLLTPRLGRTRILRQIMENAVSGPRSGL
jgi:hypothetical protein